jgi:hypothetical protein
MGDGEHRPATDHRLNIYWATNAENANKYFSAAI